jgi:hypothetical protein
MFERHKPRKKALIRILLICFVLSTISLFYVFTPAIAQDSDNHDDDNDDDGAGVCCFGLLMTILFIFGGIPLILIMTYLITKVVKCAWKD